MQVDYIREKAKKLGLDPGTSSNHEDNLRTIAKQLGMDYDLLPSLNILDRALNELLAEQGLVDDDSLDDIEFLDDAEIEETSDDESNDNRNEEKNQDENNNSQEDNLEKKDSSDDSTKDSENKKKNTSESDKKPEIDKKSPKNNEVKKTDNNTPFRQNLRNKFQGKKDALTNQANGIKNKIRHPGEAIKGKLGKKSASNMGSKAATSNTASKAVSTGAKKTGATVAKGGKAIGSFIAGGIKSIAGAIASHPYVALAILIIVIIIFVIIFIFMSLSGTPEFIGLYGYEYIQPKCTEITIKGGQYAGVYDIEEYIAGVVNAEYGGFVNSTQREAAKAGAVAARSFVLANVGDSCTVESSQNFQVYKEPTEETKKIAQETRGLVLVQSGSIKSTQYDAFCTKVAQTDPDYYIVCQKEQKIPRAWVDKQGGNILAIWKAGTMSGAHGNGMSQWGAAYLAEAEGYTFEDLLAYYYDDTEIMSIYKSFGYNGEYSIDPNNALYKGLAFLKDKSFEEFLAERGTSIEDYNNYLKKKITEAGVGTRDGVVTAAVSLIGSLAEMKIKINYQWAGKYYQVGVNPNWGSPASTLCDNYAASGYDKSVCTTNYKWSGFDCSGFVNWALINGMQNKEVATQYTDRSGGIDLSATTAVCKPGGVLVSEGHIVLVVATDDATKNYIVAEATGSRIALGTGGVKLSKYSYQQTGYVCKNLESLYGE